MESQQLAAAGQCAQGECYDEVLLQAFDRLPLDAPRDRVVVLHQLGNHGPAYHRRYPPAFARFRPACDSDELRDCSREQIVNAYDNAILYTDHVLDQVVQRLRRRQPGADVALLYVSDHGESLGEHGLYLHGLPYALAPEDQTHVPMLWWLPERSAHALGVDRACLVRHARDPASHDNLYHSLTGLLGVQVATYRPERDLFARCRLPASTAVVRGEAQGDVPATQSARDM